MNSLSYEQDAMSELIKPQEYLFKERYIQPKPVLQPTKSRESALISRLHDEIIPSVDLLDSIRVFPGEREFLLGELTSKAAEILQSVPQGQNYEREDPYVTVNLSECFYASSPSSTCSNEPPQNDTTPGLKAKSQGRPDETDQFVHDDQKKDYVVAGPHSGYYNEIFQQELTVLGDKGW